MSTALLPISIWLMIIGALIMIVVWLVRGRWHIAFEGGVAIFAAGFSFRVVVGLMAYVLNGGVHGL